MAWAGLVGILFSGLAALCGVAAVMVFRADESKGARGCVPALGMTALVMMAAALGLLALLAFMVSMSDTWGR